LEYLLHLANSQTLLFCSKKQKKGQNNMPEIFRRFPERRTGKDRRKILGLHRFFYKGPERRKALQDRRSREERREGWVRTQKWSSVNLQDLKIYKYLK
jgi:hypothetical protein